MSTLKLRFRGAVASLGTEGRIALLDRSTADDDVLRDTVAATIDAVRTGGDTVLKSLAREYDNVTLKRIDVPKSEWTKALEAIDPAVRQAMERSARNIETAHRAFLPEASEVETEPGITIGRRPDPLGRVGVYAPGGRASYPSSVLMGVIPARVAGVGEVILCSPPGAGGLPPKPVLAACAIAGVDKVFALGGAGAIAAMAYGTETVPRADRIVGPGNAWVTEAKVQVAKACAIDSPAGPSELLVIADESADVAQVAREMLAQAEHDPLACVVAVAIGDEVARQSSLHWSDGGGYSRHAIIGQALEANGGVVSVDTLDAAVLLSNFYAPEHLLLAVEEAERIFPSFAMPERSSSGDRLGLLRRLHDGGEPHPPHRRARALLLRALHARLRALDDVPARDARSGSATGGRHGEFRRRRRTGRACARRSGVAGKGRCLVGEPVALTRRRSARCAGVGSTAGGAAGVMNANGWTPRIPFATSAPTTWNRRRARSNWPTTPRRSAPPRRHCVCWLARSATGSPAIRAHTRATCARRSPRTWASHPRR